MMISADDFDIIVKEALDDLLQESDPGVVASPEVMINALLRKVRYTIEDRYAEPEISID